MADKLLPCPFCGAVPDRAEQHGYRVRCHECGACGPEASFKKLREKAWNKRPATASPQPRSDKEGGE